MGYAQMLEDLRQSLADHDPPETGALVAEIVGHILASDEPFPSDVAEDILSLLLHKRSFAGVTQIGDALLQTGVGDAGVRRLYAVALAEQGILNPAESMAEALASDAGQDADQKALAQDLLASIYQRTYVQAAATITGARKKVLLERAAQNYYLASRQQPGNRPAHAINLVAILNRAKHDGITLGGYGDPGDIAQSVATAVEDSTAATNLITAIKAAVALDDADRALDRAKTFVDKQDVDAYQISALLWDLTYVWEIDQESELGAPLLGLLKASLLVRPDFSHVEFTPAQAEAAVQGLEKVFGTEKYLPLQWVKNSLERSRAVAMIQDRNGNPMGTGFLVPGGELHDSLTGQTVLVTNNHVIAKQPSPNIGQLKVGDALARFQTLEEDGLSAEFEIESILFESPLHELDASVVKLAGIPEGIEPYRLASEMPALEEKEKAKVYVIGHPGGRTLSYSMDDNVLLGYNEQILHYRSPTERGSSGSPLFDRNWDLIGLHSRGNENMKRLDGKDGRYAANVGFRITALKNAMVAALGSGDGVQP